MRFCEWLENGLVSPSRLDSSLAFVLRFFSSLVFRFVGKGTLTFDEFCRVAVHFSEEDDEALQLSIFCLSFLPCHAMICYIARY